MARYIDLDKLLNGLEDELKDKNPNDLAYLVFKIFIGRLSKEPTADVVPRAEVARLQNQVNRLKKYDEERDIALHKRLITNAKTEAAMEIFAEVDPWLNDYRNNFCSGLQFITFLTELKKKYTGQ